MIKYFVITPVYFRSDDRYYGETGADVVEVEATTKRKAKVLGLRLLRQTHSMWVRECEGNPFNGLTVAEKYD